MNVLKPISLGDQLSKKISLWILILVAIIIAALFSVSFFLSQQMFNKQVNIWKRVVPQYALTNLIDSDHFSIQREIEFIKSTGLFSTFIITDNQLRVISKFGNEKFIKSDLIPIQDEAKSVWGYYYFEPDIYRFVLPFFIAGLGFLILILMVYFAIRWRIRSHLESEFSRFNNFLNEIENVTEKLHEVFNHDSDFQINSQISSSTEQVIINRAISRLLKEIKKANQSLREAIASAEQRRFQEEITRTALQVAHDVGSPLAVLEAIVQSASFNLSERNRIDIRNAAGRIRDISNSLLQKARKDLVSNNEEPLTQQLLQSLINQVVSEKRIQFNNKFTITTNFKGNSFHLFSFVRAGDFCRVISNLVNNAIEAIDESGLIEISLYEDEGSAIIKIQDNGKGISKEILNKLGNLGATYGKSQGFGRGLHHAMNMVNCWNGNLELKSKEGEGTTIQISLPKTQPPNWFVPEIKLMPGQTVVIIDDDSFIHDIWERKFQNFERQIELIHFNSPEDFINWYNKQQINLNIIYLSDYEFIGSDVSGIDLISQLKIHFLSILVTSRTTREVIDRCEMQNIKLLQKDILNDIPISLINYS